MSLVHLTGFQIFPFWRQCLLLSSSTGYQTFKHWFQISKHVRACRHVKIGPVIKTHLCPRRVARFRCILLGREGGLLLTSETGSGAWCRPQISHWNVDDINLTHLTGEHSGCELCWNNCWMGTTGCCWFWLWITLIWVWLVTVECLCDCGEVWL